MTVSMNPRVRRASFGPGTEGLSVDQLVRDIRNSKRLPGVEAVRLPGEQSHAKRDEHTRLGIPMPAPLLQSLAALAAELKIAPLA